AALSEAVFVDHDMWEKIVLNLISNAYKFTLEGRIGVSLTQREHEAVLAVTDTGTGIRAEELPHLFERFHRIEGARARTHEGTGIGLALVQELARLHGGSVTVESRYGEGSTFTVHIPLGRAHLPAERIAAKAERSARAGPQTAAYLQEARGWAKHPGRVGDARRARRQDRSARRRSGRCPAARAARGRQRRHAPLRAPAARAALPRARGGRRP